MLTQSSIPLLTPSIKPTFDEIKNKIQNYIQQNYIEYNSTVFISSFYISITVFIKNKKISIKIPTKNNLENWEEIKNRIDSQLKNIELSDCPLCLNEIKDVYIVSCNKCANKWCNLCYVNLIRVKINDVDVEPLSCPYCRFSFDRETPTFIEPN